MRLTDFILANVEPILAQWESFAREVWPSPASTDPAELRDHAEAILHATVADMRSDQTAAQRSAKSEGRGRDERGDASQRLDAASDQHGAGRVESGFEMAEVLAEYRALRASVIRLWRISEPPPAAGDLEDVIRFNESIDQSLARAVASFTARVDDARHLFLAVLGHDLRNPLNAITIWAKLLGRPNGAEFNREEAASHIATSAAAMARMINDLLDFTAAGLGGGMPIRLDPIDLHAICRAVVDETHATHPGCTVDYAHDGDLTGYWDAARLRQVVANLLVNAAQHGARGSAGTACRAHLRAHGQADEVVLSVHNDGPPIPPAALPMLFDPLRRAASLGPHQPHREGRLGLGLYIAHQVVTAHGGTIEVESSEQAGTTFTVRLPRTRPQP